MYHFFVHTTLNETYCAFLLSGLAELKELVFAGVNGKQCPLLGERACELHCIEF